MNTNNINSKNDIATAPNIGAHLSEMLQMAGINSLDDLYHIGSETAFVRIKTIDPTACINMLYAIEGAIQGIRWHKISKERKMELKEFFVRIK